MQVPSDEIRLDPKLGSTPIERSEWAPVEGGWLMQHMPTGTIFELSLHQDEIVDGSFEATALGARLVHVCDGRPVPDGLELIILGRASIIAFLLAHGLFPGDLVEEDDETESDIAALEDELPF